MNINYISSITRQIFYIFTAAILFGAAQHARAIVSMEDIHLGKPPDGFSGSFDFDLAFEGGNTESSGAGTGVKLQWTQDAITDFILADYAYAESAGVRSKNKGFMHYRHIHQLTDQLAWEGFGQLSFNEFTNLNSRALAGGGVRMAIGEVNDNKAMYLGLGAFYEYETLDTSLSVEARTEEALRANTYLVFKYSFNQHVSLVSTTYYQPKINEAGDFRGIEDFTLVSKLSDASALKVGVDIAHDSESPPGIKRTDSAMKVGIVINF